jgi:hypothetical protein
MTRSSILVIPGVKGFRLVDQASGAMLWKQGQQSHDRFGELILEWDRELSSCHSTGAGKAIPGELESGLYGFLRDRLYPGNENDDQSIDYFRYDWRLPSLSNRFLLAEELSKRPPKSTILIAHSLGTLLTCALLAMDDAPVASLSGIIFVAPPFAGVPSALEEMLKGDTDIPQEFREDYRQVAASFPSLFELLPVYDDALRCEGKSLSLLELSAEAQPDETTVFTDNLDYLRQFRKIVSRGNSLLFNQLTALGSRCLVVGSSGVSTPAQVELTCCHENSGHCFPFQAVTSCDHSVRMTKKGDGRVPLRSFSWLSELFPTVIIGSEQEPLNHSQIMRDHRFLNTIRQFIDSLPEAATATDWWNNPGENVRHFPAGTMPENNFYD